MILLLRVFVLNFCTSPGTSWSQRKLRRMSFGETTSTELVLPSRALSWHLLRQSQPLLLPSQPTPIPQPIGKKQWNLWITKFQSSIKCWNAGTEISKFCTLLHSTGPWMMLRMELETKRTSSSQNSKRWSSSSLMSLIHFHSSLQKHFQFSGFQQRLAGSRWGDEKAWSCKGEWKNLFPFWAQNISHLYQNDAEWEAELEGELNEYEMVNPKQRITLS